MTIAKTNMHKSNLSQHIERVYIIFITVSYYVNWYGFVFRVNALEASDDDDNSAANDNDPQYVHSTHYLCYLIIDLAYLDVVQGISFMLINTLLLLPMYIGTT